MPRVLLDSDRLEVLLARGDAREDRELRRAVRLARRELARLLHRQLDRAAPLAWPVRLGLRMRELLWRPALALPVLAGALVVAVVGVGLLLGGGGRPGSVDGPAATSFASGPPPVVPAPTGLGPAGGPAVDDLEAGTPATRPFADPATAYRGPAVTVLGPTPARFDLSYQPAGLPLYLAAFRVIGMDRTGLPVVAPTLEDRLGPMARLEEGASQTCGPLSASCVQVELVAAPEQRWLRLPTPTGSRVLPGSVTVGGRSRWPELTSTGEAVVDLGTVPGVQVRYRVVPGPAALGLPDRWPGLPARLEAEVGRLRELARPERVRRAVHLVADLVRYDAGERTAGLLAGLGGDELLRRAVEIGAGDCDVQASLLAALLNRAGVPAHLAVGMLGRDGRVRPWLHAWVEHLGDDGRWAVADVSLLGPVSPGAAAGAVSPRLGEPRGAGEAVEAGARGGSATADRPVRRWEVDLAALLAVVLGVLLVAALVVALARRMRRRERLEATADVPALLRGMIERPGAFAGLAGLEHRPLVPALGGQALSVHRCRQLAARGRLLASTGQTALAGAAAAAGAAVLQTSAPEGRVVAEALPVADLDAWHQALARAQELPWVAPLEAELRRRLGRVRVLGSYGLDQPVLLVDLGLRGHRTGLPGTPVVLVDLEQPAGRAAAGMARTHPARAAYLVAELVTDELTHHLAQPLHRGAGVLQALAGQALAEAGPGRSW